MAADHELAAVAATSARGADRAADARDRRRAAHRGASIRAIATTASPRAINRAAGGAPVAIDAETAALLRYADRCHRAERRPLRPHVGRAAARVGFPARPPRLPTRGAARGCARADRLGRVEWDDAHDSAAARAAWRSISAASARNTRPIASRRSAREHGIAHGLVNLGGDVRVIGRAARRRAVARRHPPSARERRRRSARVDLVDGAVATSGDYERFFEIDGHRYCHLLDARTGWPVAHWQSVSVVAPLAIVAGSYATIAMLLERRAPAFLAHDSASATCWYAPMARVVCDTVLAGSAGADELSWRTQRPRSRPARIGHAPI